MKRTSEPSHLDQSDEQLVERIRTSRGRDGWDELLRRHLKRIRGLVFHLLLDHDQADDVTQEIFLRVSRSLATFNGRAAFATWLNRVAFNAVSSHRERRRASPVQFHGELLEPVPDGGPAPGQHLEDQETASNVQAALVRLSPPLRTAVVLVCLHGMKPAEAAELEGCPVATIHWRVHAARQKLKSLLREHLS